MKSESKGINFLKSFLVICQEMLVLVPTFGEKFRSLVQSAILRVKEDMHLFTDAEPANFGDGVVGSSSFNNIPVDVERNTVFDEFPDICTECGPLMLLIQCCDVTHVLSVPGLHLVVGTSSVGFPVVGISPVHQVVHHAANSREDFAGFRPFQRQT